MKILLSAYSCEPNKGSESEVGWRWAKELSAKGNDVYVITRSNNQNTINEELSKINIKNLKFLYFDFPSWFIKIIKGKFNKFSYIYFYLWQIGIYLKFKKFIKNNNFDFIHHVTFVSYRFPSFLSLCNVPFIYGPLSGGEEVPIKLRKSFSLKNKIKERFRDLSNKFISISPFINMTLKRAIKIIVNTEHTKKKIPKSYHHKTFIELAIAIDEQKSNINQNIDFDEEKLNLCFVGNYEHIKGINIILKIIKKLKIKNHKFFFNFIGSGSLEKYIKENLKKNEFEDCVKIHKKISQDKIFEFMKKNHVLVFPALRDSGGIVLLEAMSVGLPSAILDLGGPSQIINNECGIVINSKKKNEDEIANDFYFALKEVINDRNKLKHMSVNCLKRVKIFSWYNKLNKVYENK
jgi:glycosyltransferase involved in cell wall biosynthesis